jgi:non-reducing end alpha-L-arabinofuranosidase
MKNCNNPPRRLSVISAVLASLALMASARHVQAAQLQVSSNAPYLCAAVSGGSISNGTPVIAYNCAGSFWQQWNYVGGQFQGIGTTGSTSMCLDVQGNGVAAGTLVDLFQCNGQQNQQWVVINAAATTGITFILGVQSGLCLDSAGGPSTGGGTQLIINNCNYGSSQTWIVRHLELQLNTGSPHTCAVVEGSKTANGTPVISYSCSGGFNDEWNLNKGQIQGIGTANGTSKCLTTAGSTAGSLVKLSTCVSGSATQEWWFENGAGDDCPSCGLIFSARTGLCLDSSGGPPTGGGTQLVVNDCTGAASQNWIVR